MTELAKYLIDHGADVNIQNKQGFTALMMACLNNNTELVKYLIFNRADANIINNQNKTAYNFANKKIKHFLRITNFGKLDLRNPKQIKNKEPLGDYRTDEQKEEDERFFKLKLIFYKNNFPELPDYVKDILEYDVITQIFQYLYGNF